MLGFKTMMDRLSLNRNASHFQAANDMAFKAMRVVQWAS